MKTFVGGVEWPSAMVVTAWKLEEARVRKRWNFEKRFPIVKQLKEVLIFLFWRTLLSYFLVFVFLLIIYALLRLYLNPGDPDAVWVGSFIAGHALFFSFVFVSLWYVQFRRLRINMAADAMGRISTFLQDHEKTAGELRLTFIAGLKLDLSDPASKIRFLSYIEALGKMLQLAEDGGVTPKAVRSFFEGQILDLLRSTDIVSEFFATEDDVKRLWLPERSNFIRLVMLMTEGGRGDRGFWDYLAVPFMNGEPFVRVFCQVAQMMSSLPPTLRLKDRYFNSFLLRVSDQQAVVHFDTSNTLGELRRYLAESTDPEIEVLTPGTPSLSFMKKTGNAVVKSKEESHIFVWECLQFGLMNVQGGIAVLQMRSNGKHFLEQQGKKKSSVGAALEDVNPEYRSDTIMDDKGNENEKLVTD